MNEEQTVPPSAGSPLAALVIGGVAILALVVWWFSDKKKAETPLSGAENGNTGTKPFVPPPASAPAAPAAPSPAAPPIPPVSVPAFPPPGKGRTITCEDLAATFNGARGLTRKAAVSALKSLGFGKTAAYAALSPDGRFSASLECTPDGIITWKT